MRITALFVFLSCLLPLSLHAELPEPVQRALKASNIPGSSVAFLLAPAGGGKALMSHNADKAFNPASVMKLVTTSAALDLLGPTYTWTTEVHTVGTVKNGVLTGDLVLRGSGDPSLSWDRFGQLLRELRGRGIQDIRGDLVLDRSLFAIPPVGNFDDQPLRAYNAQPDAMLVNFKALSLRLTPQELQPVSVVSMTPYAPLQIDNQLRATAGSCVDWRSGIVADLEAAGEGLRVRLSGTMPASCGERLMHLAVQDGPRFAAGIFRALWSELGGSWQGRLREGSVPVGSSPYAIWKSPPLADVIRDINKYSNNVMARQLLLTLGSSRNTEATASGIRQADTVVRDWLHQNQIDQAELVIENGAGLSRNERITAEGLGRLLQFMWQSPRMPILAASLPLAGGDGTARRRFAERPIAGRAYLKTGSLNNVMSNAGYVQDATGNWFVLVWMINDARAEFGEAATVQASDWVFERAATLSACCLRSERASGKDRRGN